MNAEKATDAVGQKYVFTTFDLGVCMKAYPLIWNYPVKFDRHIVMIGMIHLVCGYYKMLGKKMEGSGFDDVLLEANLISSGSLQGVLLGKNYSRATRCHKVLTEALHRLLFSEFSQTEEGSLLFSDLLKHKDDYLFDYLNDLSKDSMKVLVEDNAVCAIVESYLKFCETVRRGDLGKNPQFWLSYMDHVSLVLLLMRAVKLNDFELYAHCLNLMTDIFFSFGGQNYAQYLTFFSQFVSNLDFSHPGAVDQIRLGVISVARSFIPGSRCAVDKTMEETFMRHAKSKGGSGTGITGITQLKTMADNNKRVKIR